MARAKYTNRMSDIIWTRMSKSRDLGTTATKILKDFKSMYSVEAMRGMSKASIYTKYYSLQKAVNKGTYTPPTEVKSIQTVAAPTKATNITDLKQQIVNALMSSQDMTITFNGTEVTAVFK